MLKWHCAMRQSYGPQEQVTIYSHEYVSIAHRKVELLTWNKKLRPNASQFMSLAFDA